MTVALSPMRPSIFNRISYESTDWTDSFAKYGDVCDSFNLKDVSHRKDLS